MLHASLCVTSSVSRLCSTHVTQSMTVEVAGLSNVSRVTVEQQVGINGHAKRLELRCDRQSASSNVDGGDVGS